MACLAGGYPKPTSILAPAWTSRVALSCRCSTWQLISVIIDGYWIIRGIISLVFIHSLPFQW